MKNALSRVMARGRALDPRHVISILAILAFAALALGSAAAPH